MKTFLGTEVRPIGELLRDRGLLAQTLVIVLGEFGRTPKINGKAGRDHWEHCYSALLAGGGSTSASAFASSSRCATATSRPRLCSIH